MKPGRGKKNKAAIKNEKLGPCQLIVHALFQDSIGMLSVVVLCCSFLFFV